MFAVAQFEVFYIFSDPTYLTSTGDVVPWPKYTVTDPQLLVFDTNMSSSSDSMQSAEAFQNALNFWLAIENVAQWGDSVASEYKIS